MHMLALSITGAIGQMFVYWMINYFRQHVVPFVITTRKLLTVGISIIYFNHEVTFMQIIGIILVFGIICYDFIG
jgi:UDP-galactose transporter B1